LFEKAVVLGLYSITPVHAGSGAELSVIDLPIQRERHTGFPVIWGQSLKGVLRSKYGKIGSEEKTEVIFGPPTDKAHEHAGAISCGDSKILLFPVRSAKGVFAYVTCPMVLERFVRDLELVGADGFKIPQVQSQNTVVLSQNSVLDVDGKVYIEDIALNAEKGDISDLTSAISRISPIDIDERRVAVVHNDIFSILVQMATEIVARVRIRAETGTVDEGALWYEEYLPSDTLMYSVVAIAEPRRQVSGVSSVGEIVRELKKFNGKFLQIGGNETIGKGFVKLKVVDYEDS